MELGVSFQDSTEFDKCANVASRSDESTARKFVKDLYTNQSIKDQITIAPEDYIFLPLCHRC